MFLLLAAEEAAEEQSAQANTRLSNTAAAAAVVVTQRLNTIFTSQQARRYRLQSEMEDMLSLQTTDILYFTMLEATQAYSALLLTVVNLDCHIKTIQPHRKQAETAAAAAHRVEEMIFLDLDTAMEPVAHRQMVFPAAGTDKEQRHEHLAKQEGNSIPAAALGLDVILATEQNPVALEAEGALVILASPIQEAVAEEVAIPEVIGVKVGSQATAVAALC